LPTGKPWLVPVSCLSFGPCVFFPFLFDFYCPQHVTVDRPPPCRENLKDHWKTVLAFAVFSFFFLKSFFLPDALIGMWLTRRSTLFPDNVLVFFLHLFPLGFNRTPPLAPWSPATTPSSLSLRQGLQKTSLDTPHLLLS